MTIAQQLQVTDFPFSINDKDGNEIYYEASDGTWSKTEYDAKGKMIYHENSDGGWCKSEYDARGREIYFESSNGWWSKREYDAQSNEIYFEDSNGTWSKKEYDSNGNIIYLETSSGVIRDNRPKIDQRTYEMLAKMEDRAKIAENQLAAALEEIVELNEECGTWWAQKRTAIDELKEVTEQRDHWKARCLQQNKDLGYELRDPNGTIWSECKRLQSELTAAQDERLALCVSLENQLIAAFEQRDTLAENLKQIYNVSSFDYDTMPEAARKKYREVVFAIADKALQSLTEKLT